MSKVDIITEIYLEPNWEVDGTGRELAFLSHWGFPKGFMYSNFSFKMK